ncbi:hypothetical protein Scep_028652 [Stephania cephalantha]|uniref:Uncharacterized protein n=1 Tax=Stephania cephalantha TaxID=152367 RepID=A0AAP0ECF3_9MAGN
MAFKNKFRIHRVVAISTKSRIRPGRQRATAPFIASQPRLRSSFSGAACPSPASLPEPRRRLCGSRATPGAGGTVRRRAGHRHWTRAARASASPTIATGSLLVQASAAATSQVPRCCLRPPRSRESRCYWPSRYRPSPLPRTALTGLRRLRSAATMARQLAGAPCCCCWWSIRRFRPSWPSASRLRLYRRRGCRLAGPRAAVVARREPPSDRPFPPSLSLSPHDLFLSF